MPTKSMLKSALFALVAVGVATRVSFTRDLVIGQTTVI